MHGLYYKSLTNDGYLKNGYNVYQNIDYYDCLGKEEGDSHYCKREFIRSIRRHSLCAKFSNAGFYKTICLRNLSCKVEKMRKISTKNKHNIIY